MRRHLLIVAIFLLAGAVVNVGVAWGCALWSPVLKTEWIDKDQTWARHRAWGIGWSAISQPLPLGSSTTIEAGFPLACVGGDYIWMPHGGFGGYDTRFLIGWERGERWPKPPRPFPLRPIWPGFAVNTLCYAAILWLLILGPFVLRRFIRMKRGLCPACAYPMGESNVCSECGRALPQTLNR